MTKKFLFITTLFFYLSSCSTIKPFNNASIIGKWESKNEIVFEFFENSKCSFNVPYKNTVQTLQGIFFINNSKNLKTIDIKKIDGVSFSFYGIFDFVDENTIKISKFSTIRKTRPISFEKNNFLTLNRKKINGSN